MATVQTPGALATLRSSIVLGVRVHHVTMAQAVDVVRHMVRSGASHQVATVNGVMLVRAAHDERIRRVLNDASLAIADGVGVQLAARIAGKPHFARVPGVELVQAICAAAVTDCWRVFLLGAAPSVAAAAADALRHHHPGLIIAGVMDGYFTDDSRVIERIRESRPQVLFVATGFPKQDLWIASHRHHLAVPVSIGVGGTLDVLAGRVSRAPEWTRRLGLEWAYRVVQEPRRWRVVVSLPSLLLLAALERVRQYRKMPDKLRIV